MTLLKSLLVGCMVFYATEAWAFKSPVLGPDSTGLPGDYFSLEGALELFKNANSLEEFERTLNTPDNYCNNLDLNEDGAVDYVKVVDHVEGNAHAIVLQTSVSETESQDIAVIEIEKNGNQSVLVQIIGDEELYGEERIVESNEVRSTPEPVRAASEPQKIVVNAWGWPSVRYIYAPGYVVYQPAWRWRHYPVYWQPWRPHPLAWHYSRPRPFRTNYRVVRVHRSVYAPRIYRPHRTTSVVVKNRYHVTRVNRNHAHVHVHKTNNRPVRTKVVKTKNNRDGRRGERGGR
ncbi:MAG: hypothetical protein H7Z75_20720 [Ferruginibacter sp.]|nr:hypothetical protein [Cytophagales bacterium]